MKKVAASMLGLVVALAAATVCTDAVAQKTPPKLPPIAPTVTLPLKPAPTAPRRERIVNAGENGIRGGSMLVANSASDLQGGQLMTGFRLRFANGDHKVRTLGVRPQGVSTLFSMADQNTDDTFDAAASWIEMNGVRSDVVAAHGGGQFTIPLPAGRVPGHRIVLSGFDFFRDDGTDANIRTVGVWLDEATSSVTVSLLDDQGADFRRVAEGIARGMIAGAPDIGALGAVVPAKGARPGRLPPAGRFRPFLAQVQFVYVPESFFTGGPELFTGTSRNPSSGKIIPARSVIQGFEFFFENGDHHLLDVGVMTPLAEPFFRTRTPRLPLPPNEVVFFQDGNRDDPIRWSMRTLTLAPIAP